MQMQIDEIQQDIFRISLFPTDSPISFSTFLIRDDKPALIHTGHQRTFNVVLEQISKLIDVEKLGYICFSHFEPDECGSLIQWSHAAPNAQVCTNKIGESSVKDTGVVSKIFADGDRINLGRHELLILETPHFPHNWESMLLYDVTSKTVFSSDIGTQKGHPQKTDSEPDLAEIMILQNRLQYIPYGPHVTRGLAKLRGLDIDMLAPMHGKALDRKSSTDLLNLIDAENNKAFSFANGN
jgi:flavorubredoxin